MYNKLFTKILDSSIWLEPYATRVVWITLIASMDEDSYCHYSCIENLARRAGVTEEEADTAIQIFINPDRRSGDPEFEGRRIECVPGGYLILNGQKYRDIYNRSRDRELTRLRVQKHRSKKSTVTESNAHVTVGNACNNGNACNEPYSEAYSEAEASVLITPSVPSHIKGTLGARFAPPTLQQVSLQCSKIGLPESEAEAFLAYYTSNGWKVGRNPMKSWTAALTHWRSNFQKRLVTSQSNGHSTSEKILAAQELERLRQRKRSIKSSYDPHQSWDEQDRAEFQKLKSREATLLQTIGATV